MTGTRNLRPAGPWGFLLLLGVFLAAGCSTNTTEQALVSHLDAQGKSNPGWVVPFPGPSLHSKAATEDFINTGTSNCAECHGADLTGGISRVSCFLSACHHNPVVTNWSNPAAHGAAAKKAPGSSSFFSCQICHAKDFSGGGSGVACFPCHGVNAPHPVAPWHGAGGTNHNNTDIANARVCAACHFPGSANNPAGHPAAPAPAGTPPGCFNNTLCHGPETTPHILGATWRDPTSAAFHGLEAKQNLLFCQACHGTPGTILFDGGSAPTGCSDCHTAAKAHPATWYPLPAITFPGYVPSHRNASNQAAACSICHDFTQGRTPPDAAAPSCFSASFANAEHGSVGCHAAGPGAPNHLIPYLDPDHLGVDTAGFNVNCANCHAVSGGSPVTTAPACQVCHTAGSPVLPGGSFGNCSSCHGSSSFTPFPDSQPNGTVYPNIAGAHAKHLALGFIPGGSNAIDCDTCHDGLGFVTQAHYDRANARPGSNALRVEPGDVSFIAGFPYLSQTGGPAAFDNSLIGPTALTCSAVSCHGGPPLSPAPNWRTGTIATGADAGCRMCHKAGSTITPQYNDVTNNVHPTHILHAFTRGIGCTTCHDPVELTPLRHFGNLADNAIAAGAARATIRAALAYNPPGAVSISSCTTACHGG